jgi:hypothetical protein
MACSGGSDDPEQPDVNGLGGTSAEGGTAGGTAGGAASNAGTSGTAGTDLWLNVPSGAQPILSIAGVIGDATTDDSYWAYLVFGAGDAVASWAVVVTGDQPTTMSTYEIARALPGATFTPIYWEYSDAPEPTVLTGDALSVLPEGLPLFPMYVNPGAYFLITSVGDIWGNSSSEVDALTVTEALGP